MPLADVRNKRQRVPLQCACGEITTKRIQDVLRGKQVECGKCAASSRAKACTDIEHLRQISMSAAKVNTKPREWVKLRKLCQSAIARCHSPTNTAYHNYGARGIQVQFSSASAMAQWIVDNLGYPTAGASLDRINNDGNYEPGNLQWASRAEQANNKRQYCLAEPGMRIRRLLQRRPDVTYETIRSWIKRGLSDEQIVDRKKSTSGRPRLRHT